MTASLVHPAPRRHRPPARADAHGAETGTAAARPSRVAKIVRALVSVTASTLMVAAVMAFLFLAVGPRVLGYQTSTMLTGSMAPLINPGDVVVTVPVSVTDLKVGDIITYHIPVQDQRVETHRIVKLAVNAQGTATVQTKGDANNGADPWTATLAPGHVEREAFTVPYLGNAIRALRDPLVLHSLMYGAPAALVVMLLMSIWRKKPENDDDGPGSETTDRSDDATAPHLPVMMEPAHRA